MGRAIFLSPCSGCLACSLNRSLYALQILYSPFDSGFLSIVVSCFKDLSDVLLVYLILVLKVVHDTSRVGLTIPYSSVYVSLMQDMLSS